MEFSGQSHGPSLDRRPPWKGHGRIQRRQRRPVSSWNARGLRPMGGVGKLRMAVREGMFPYLRKLEADQDFADELHGSDGPISCRRYQPDEWGPQQRAFYRACRDAGFPDCPDHNRPNSTGVGPLAFNVSGRMRVSTAMAYLDPARHRTGLDHQTPLPGRRDHLRRPSSGGTAGHQRSGGVGRLWRRDHPLRRRHRFAAHSGALGYRAWGPIAAVRHSRRPGSPRRGAQSSRSPGRADGLADA